MTMHPAAPLSGHSESDRSELPAMPGGEDIVARLRNTPNWMRESYGHWKSCTLSYDRAPFEAADEIERLRAAAQVSAPADLRAHVHEAWWLIEHAAMPNPAYLSGIDWKVPRGGMGPNIPVEQFTADPCKAIRFPSEASAKMMLEALIGERRDTAGNIGAAIVRRNLSTFRVAEHIFDYTPPVAPVSAAFAAQTLPKQESLGTEFEQVLIDNRFSLYSTDHAAVAAPATPAQQDGEQR